MLGPEVDVARRLECLDGLRGLLALYVLVSHMAPFAALPGWMTHPFSHGEAAVDVFFVLSGMVIVRSLESHSYDRHGFLFARAARTLPVFLVVFAVAVAVQPLPTALPWMPWMAPGDPGRAIWSTGWPGHWAVEIGAHLTMTHGLLPESALPGAWVSFLGAAWSLSTEWQFYVLVAFLAPALSRRVGLSGLSRGFLTLAVLALAWAWAAPGSWQFSRAFLPNKAQYFALGIASAGWATDASPRAERRFALVLCATLALCAVQGGLGKLAAPLLWTVCLGAQRACGTSAGGLRWIAGGLRAPPLLALGAASYCIYLVNEPTQKLLALALAAVAGGNGALFTVLWVPTAIALPLALAWVLHKRIEQPALRAGRGLMRRSVVPAG
jgi:peptidoglycan/LPS O-acetylase OafA/YrhL